MKNKGLIIGITCILLMASAQAALVINLLKIFHEPRHDEIEMIEYEPPESIATDDNSDEQITILKYNINLNTPQTVWDNEGIKIIVTSVEEQGKDILVNLLIDNETDTKYKFEGIAVSINNQMFTTTSNKFEIPVNESIQEKVILSHYYLDDIEFEGVNNISVSYRIYNPKTHDTLFTDVFLLDSLVEYEASPLPDAPIIISNEYVDVYYLGVKKDGYGKETASVLIYNKSDKFLIFDTSSLAVNNFVIINHGICFLNPKSYDTEYNNSSEFSSSVFEFTPDTAVVEMAYEVYPFYDFDAPKIKKREKYVFDEDFMPPEKDMNGVLAVDKENIELVISNVKYDSELDRYYIDFLAKNTGNRPVKLYIEDIHLNNIDCRITDFKSLMPDTYVAWRGYIYEDITKVLGKEVNIKINVTISNMENYEDYITEKIKYSILIPTLE